MANITLSAGVRQNLLALQNTASLLGTTQNRLATGKKVNSALDNPSNFFTSVSLQARASDLSNLLDSMSNGIKTLESADNGLKAITRTVESMQSIVRQARQDKSTSVTPGSGRRYRPTHSTADEQCDQLRSRRRRFGGAQHLDLDQRRRHHPDERRRHLQRPTCPPSRSASTTATAPTPSRSRPAP